MKKILMLLMLLFTAPVMAEESSCYDNPDENIKQLMTELKSCYNIHSDSPSFDVMVSILNQQANCAIDVANKIFDTYYTNKNALVKEKFKKWVEITNDCALSMMYDSDIGMRDLVIGQVYFTTAIGLATTKIQEFVEDYLNRMRANCEKRNDWTPEDEAEWREMHPSIVEEFNIK